MPGFKIYGRVYLNCCFDSCNFKHFLHHGDLHTNLKRCLQFDLNFWTETDWSFFWCWQTPFLVCFLWQKMCAPLPGKFFHLVFLQAYWGELIWNKNSYFGLDGRHIIFSYSLEKYYPKIKNEILNIMCIGWDTGHPYHKI